MRYVLLLMLLAGCARSDAPASGGPAPAPVAAGVSGGTTGGASATAAPRANAAAGATPAAGHAEVAPLDPAGRPVADVIRAALPAARARGRDVIVYVGASWCEPCMRFHDAVAAGQLDETFPTLTLLELDLDRDRAGLEEAGYRSRMIPLFAVPADDGRSTGRMIQGSVKGEGAVANIVPRLQELLTGVR